MADTWYLWTGPVAFTPNRSFLGIFNSAGSGKVVLVHGCWLRNMQLDPIGGVVVQFDFYRTTAQSGGNAVVARAADTSNPPFPGSVLVASDPAVTNDFQLWSVLVSNEEVGVKGGDVGGAAMLQHANWIPDARVNASLQALTLREGQGFNIQVASAPNTTLGSYGIFAVVTV